MRAFLVPQMAKLIRKERLPEAALCRAAREVLAGTLGAGEADLGEAVQETRRAAGRRQECRLSDDRRLQWERAAKRPSGPALRLLCSIPPSPIARSCR
jgi:hypothetical protein